MLREPNLTTYIKQGTVVSTCMGSQYEILPVGADLLTFTIFISLQKVNPHTSHGHLIKLQKINK